MFKKQIKIQKIVCYTVLAVCAIAFIFALGIMTDFSQSLRPGYDPDLLTEHFKGGKLFYDFQPYNRTVVGLALACIIVSLTLFISGCQSRRLYYIGNYVASIGSTIFIVISSIVSIVIISTMKTRFLNEVNFHGAFSMEEFVATNPGTYVYSESTLWLDLAMTAFILLLIVSLFLIVNLIWKISLMKKEKDLLGEGKARVQ